MIERPIYYLIQKQRDADWRIIQYQGHLSFLYPCSAIHHQLSNTELQQFSDRPLTRVSKLHKQYMECRQHHDQPNRLLQSRQLQRRQ